VGTFENYFYFFVIYSVYRASAINKLKDENSQKNRLQNPDSCLSYGLWDVSYICLMILGEGNGII